MNRVTSRDGTQIAFDRIGTGPAIILAGGGGGVDRGENAPLAEELAKHFTVINYDRRGRGESGDTAPYAIEREFDDIAALIDAVGGSAFLYGVSSGGALALEAAAAGLPVTKIGVFEVPYDVYPGAPERHSAYTKELSALLAEDRRGAAFELFMRLAGTPEEFIAQAPNSPLWPILMANAPTLAYDAACLNDGGPPNDRLAAITQPVLVLTGQTIDRSMAGLGAGFFADAADAIVAAIPKAERAVIPQEGHVADPKSVAPVLRQFLDA
jgi:pimeloyl-ACP methyl ester carboxylesterase